jgi:hypothetical protein
MDSENQNPQGDPTGESPETGAPYSKLSQLTESPEQTAEAAETPGKKAKDKAAFSSPVRAPWIPLAMATKTIGLLALSTILLTVVTIALSVLAISQLSRKPWIVGYNNGKYSETDPQRFRVGRDDVETFLGDVLPRLYGTINGEAPGLDMLRTTVNPNIVSSQRENIEGQKEQLRREGISQFSIVTGIVPETLVINRKENFVYAEATGVVMMTKENKSTPSEVQWRTLLYIVDPISGETTKTPGGSVAGNQYGLYLQQVVEQTPGTINPDSPKPTTEDEQERKEQEMLRKQSALPSINLAK